MGKFEQANDIVIQSGFRNPEFKDLSVASSSKPSATSDGVALPKSERAFVTAKAATTVGRVDVWGLLKTVDEWRWLGHFEASVDGDYIILRDAGLLSRIYAQCAGDVTSAKVGYPVDE